MLASALVRHDFSFAYVAAHTSRTLPTMYALSAFWGGQEGSLLLWLLVLTGYGALAVAINRQLLRDLVAWVVPVIGGIATFFAFMLVVVSSPFGTQARTIDGAGLVPSLQNPYMVAHPPMLYLGYVGLTIPFAFAAGAMLSGRTDERWIVATRRWTLAAWMFLGFGQLLGAHWAYVEVGWGGYYAWDPVENAALMPWLAATAFLHSVMIQERKGMLRIWNMVLVALAFELSIFGTFLTRSGVINSIHSFAKSSIGAWFLVFVVVTALFSIALILWRLPLLRARTKLESALSREAAFLYNNLLLVALALTILWGVIFPILTQLYDGQTRTIGRPYYDFFLRAFGLPLLLLMGIGPLIAWRRTTVRSLAADAPLADERRARRRRRARRSPAPARPARPDRVHVLRVRPHDDRRRARPRDSGHRLALRARLAQPPPLRRLHRPRVRRAARDRRSPARAPTGRRASSKLSPGQSMTVDRQHAHLPRARAQHERDRDARRGRCSTISGRTNGTLRTGVNNYFTGDDSREVGIHTNWLRGEDLYVIFDQRDGNTVFFKVLVKPLVNLIWLAGIVFVLGSLVALWPDAREQRRLVARLALAKS